jgi:hypothetical protein
VGTERANTRLKIITLAAIPAELVSFLLFMSFPIDVGYPPGTPRILYVTLIGVWLHSPALFAGAQELRPELAFPVLLVSGYITLVLLALLFGLLYRLLKRRVSTL